MTLRRFIRTHRKHALSLAVCVGIVLGAAGLEYVQSPQPQNTYLRAAYLGSKWFLEQQDADFLHYTYDLQTDTYGSTTSRLRETSSLWSIATAAAYFNDARLQALARKGLAHFEAYLDYDAAGNYYYVAITPEIHLGYSAFLILSLLQMDVPKRDEYLTGLARGILADQNPNGSFNTYFFTDDVTTNADYYPGEALLALISLYQTTHDEQYLSAVERALPYYRRQWQEHPSTAFTVWQSQYAVRTYDVTHDPNIPPFVFSMADFVLKSYAPTEECSGFAVGSNAALNAHTEGIVAAYSLARELGDTRRTQCYAQFVREASDYLVARQIRDRRAFPPQAIGGFQSNAALPELRIDRNQHAVMALLAAYSADILR